MFQVASLRLIKLLFPRVVCLKATAPYCVQPGEKRAGSILSSRECRQPTKNAPIIEKLPFQRYSDDIVRTGISVTNACENNVLSLIGKIFIKHKDMIKNCWHFVIYSRFQKERCVKLQDNNVQLKLTTGHLSLYYYYCRFLKQVRYNSGVQLYQQFPYQG